VDEDLTVETRTAPGPAALGYANAVMGIFRAGGFTIAQVHHALHIFGSRLRLLVADPPSARRVVRLGCAPAPDPLI
jgi:hypothetical protein